MNDSHILYSIFRNVNKIFSFTAVQCVESESAEKRLPLVLRSVNKNARIVDRPIVIEEEIS